MIPNLVKIVKGYAKYENQTLTEIVKLRNINYDNISFSDKIETNQKLSNSLSKIMAVAENYIKECNTYEELVEEIDEYIDYYNNYRGQCNLKKMIPVEYRNHLQLVA